VGTQADSPLEESSTRGLKDASGIKFVNAILFPLFNIDVFLSYVLFMFFSLIKIIIETSRPSDINNIY
jgi:multisubunit Na+/H+ antiporter MnhB subunit